VGVLTPRSALGPDFQEFDPSQDIEFGYVSSGKTYHGQWVKVPVVLGGPARNPLLHISYQGARLKHGYIVTQQGVDVGLTANNIDGFAFIALERDSGDDDWLPPLGSVDLSGDFSPEG